MKKRMAIMLVLCVLVLGGVFGFKLFGKSMMMKGMAAMSNPLQTVSTITATSLPWQSELKAVGTLRAAKGADLSPEIGGIVENTFMESGQDVDEGTVLFQLRSGDDIAKLQALVAQARLAELTVARDQALIKTQAISQATLETDMAGLENLKAQIEAQNVTLQKKTIVAPFSGRLGIRQVDVGQFVPAGTTMVTLQQLDPLFMDFFVPQQELARIQVGQKLAVSADAYKDRIFEGEIVAIGAKVDDKTRNIDVRASLKNPDKVLRPGMFASAALSTGAPQAFVTLPQTAITFNPYGSTVYIIKDGGVDEGGKPKKTATMTFVETGLTRGDQIAVLKGVAEGDEVVTAGQLKLRNGSSVIINNTVVPTNDENPAPKDR
ncbi:MAG: efflux RND transporter periplasmic adaptor subunit [Bdellovibrionales bacterium]|jgi:membrane fusion protein (multidrug efflux system)